MFKYNYYRAKTVDEVCEQLMLHKENIRIIAGGTDIMVQIRDKEEKWKELSYLLDITFLEKELRCVKEEGNEIHIGALATHTDLETSKVIQNYLPFLGKAASTVGSPQIRNKGTIGGSICNASPAADPLTPLIAADTRVVIRGVHGTREVSLPEFYIGKGAIDLQEGEFVTTFIVDKLPEGAKTGFVKLGRRKALAISRLNASVVVKVDEANCITYARIAPGCIFVKPDRVRAAEELLLGQLPTLKLFKQAGAAVSKEMIDRTGVRWSTEYKQPAVEAMIEDALIQVFEMEVD